MIIFEISINKQKPTLVGISGRGAISAVVSSMQKSPGQDSNCVKIEVGGLANKPNGVRQYLRWLSKSLSPGDEITIKIRTGLKCNRPKSKRVETPKDVQIAKKRYLKRLKQEIKRPVGNKTN